MIRRAACLPLLLGLAVPAAVSAEDGRIAVRAYDPARIVTLAARAGIQSTIAFADDERIENVAVGDSAAWQVTPNKRASLLFVKPIATAARTNMTVVTDRRTYLFDLVAARATPVYLLRFSYPRAVAAPIPVVAIAAPPPPVDTLAAMPATAAPDPAALHFDWTQAGARALLPQRLFDDGRETWLAWGRDAALPAILQREPGGAEGPVNYTVRGDYVVVDGVPGQLVLRQGKQVATLTPGPRPAATSPAPAGAQTASLAR